MKNLKRLLVLLLAMSVLLSVTACKNNPKSDGSLSDYSGSEINVSGTLNEDGDSNGDTSSDSSNNSSVQTGPSGNGSTPTTTTSKKLNFGGKTINIIYEYQPSSEYGIDPSRDRELDRIKELNKKFNVNIVMKKGGTNYIESIVSSIAAGSPVGHIIRISGNRNYDFIKSGLCANLNDAMKSSGINMKSEQYSQRVNQYYNVNGNQYVAGIIIPQESDVYQLWFYNKEILAELGYKADYLYNLQKSGKWTWGEATKLFAAASKKTSAGVVTRYGLCADNAMRLVTTLTLLNGGKIGTVGKNGNPRANLGDAKVRAAMQQVYDWGFVQKYAANTESEASLTKFIKGEAFFYAATAGQAKKLYNNGVNFGILYPPKGPNGSKNMAPVKTGSAFMIPVTYQKQADILLMLLDALYAPYSDASREDILKNDVISYLSDSESWNVYRNATLNESFKVDDPFTAFNIEFVDPDFYTVCKTLLNGTRTPGVVVEKFNDQYQAILDDLFKGYALTGVK